MVTIIDYRAGNLTSVKNAFAAIGEEAVMTSDPETVNVRFTSTSAVVPQKEK